MLLFVPDPVARFSLVKTTGPFTGFVGKCGAADVSAVAPQYGVACGDTKPQCSMVVPRIRAVLSIAKTTKEYLTAMVSVIRVALVAAGTYLMFWVLRAAYRLTLHPLSHYPGSRIAAVSKPWFVCGLRHYFPSFTDSASTGTSGIGTSIIKECCYSRSNVFISA
jgi:hypothetical protein